MPANIHQVAERYAQLKIELNKIDAEMEILKEKLQEQGPEIYDTKYGIVKVSQMAESKRFDTKRFRVEQPDMFERYLTLTIGAYMKIVCTLKP